MKSVLESALHLLDLGMALVPVPRGEKGPRARGWQLPQNLITDPAQAEQVFARPMNVGAHLGASGLFSLDIDNMDLTRTQLQRFDIHLDEIIASHLHPISARGTRYWYRIPEGLVLNNTKRRKVLVDGQSVCAFELRCGEVQDIAPGSLHPAGMEYQWVRGAPAKRLDIPEAHSDLVALYLEWAEAWQEPEARQVTLGITPPSRGGNLSDQNQVAALMRRRNHRRGQDLDPVDVRRWIRAHYTVPQMMEHYGIPVNAQGKCHCTNPEHPDRHPSMSVQPNYAYCHSCHHREDVISLVKRYEGLHYRAAVMALGYPVPHAAQRRSQQPTRERPNLRIIR